MRSYNLEKEFLNKSNCGTGLVYNKETEQFDVTLDIKTEHLIKVTWQELVDLKNLSALEPGVFYRITDYEFTSTDPEVINAGHRFDIIVLALSEDTLSEDARAIQHEFTEEEKEIYSEEEQHYFDSSELSAWKLKYSLDGTSSRFSWAPTNKNYGINVYTSVGNLTLYRNNSKDEGIYYAFSNDNYTYYTTSEEPVEGDLLYEKEDGLIRLVFRYDIWYNAKRILIKSDYSENYYSAYLDENDNYIKDSGDSYTIDRYNYDGFSIIYYNSYEYIVVDETYSYIDEDGTTKTGILVTRKNYSTNWLHKGNNFNVNFCMTFTDYVKSGEKGNPFSESYTFTLTKLPEIGDTIEVKLGDDSYVPYTYVSLSERNISHQITYVRDCTKVLGTIPKNTTYRGVIYGMIDEFENDCEYDFKNALITGRYSLFDPDLFYYTFTNLGSTPSLLKSEDEPILLYPGTYTFLGCMPFRLYEEPNYITYVLPIITDEGYDSWDFYAALTDEEELDSETDETLYKVDMFVMPGYYNSSYDSSHQHLIRIFEDRKWYVKELIDPDNLYYGNQDRKNIIVYSKDSKGNIKEYSTKLYEYFNCTKLFGEYLINYKAWIYDACFKDNEFFQDFINLNINSSPFDIVKDLNNYASGIIYGNRYEEIKFVVDNNGCFGVYYQYYNKPYTIKWIKQGFPISVEGDGTEFAIYEGTSYKFTKPITITEPMYVYLSPYNTTAKYAESYVLGDIMLSPKKIIESGDTGYDLYCTNRDYSELNGDLYAWSFTVVNPNDTSCAYSYYSPDCYRVTLRNSLFGGTFKVIPKVIMDDVLSSTIEAQLVFLQNCYCVKARNGYSYGYPYGDTFGNYWNSDNKLFLRNVYFAELLDVDGCTIEDCYCINITRVRNSHIRHYCQALKANDCQNIILDYVDESTVEHCNNIQVYHVWGSHLFKCFNDGSSSMNIIRGLTDSTLYNILNCNINANGPISYSGDDYSKIYINGLKYKDIELSNYLSLDDRGSRSSRCVHIRSEDDLTITV